MPQITDLNVAPYYDDYNEDDNFHRVLFRPGFAIQARELTTLQSILQNQVERHGKHMFVEGTVVIPGQVSYSDQVATIQLASTFAGETIVPSQYYNATSPVILTGATTGLKARVIGVQEATATTQPILIIQYLNTGSDFQTAFFSDGENLSADVAITHTTSYVAETISTTTFSSNASQRGSAVKIEEGVYFVRGQFVKCQEETLILSTNSIEEDARIGFKVTETLQTPETDASLTDNATGSNNYAAKGAHRLKIDLTLSKLDIDSTADTNFIELVTIRQGSTQANNTELTDEKLIPSGITKLNQVKKFSGNSEGFIPGCCTVLKKEFLSLILPLSKNMEYDSWIHFVAINTNSRLVNNEILQYYRRHESNTTMHLVSKLENINRKERYIKAFKRFFFTSQDKNRKIFNKMNYEESKILKKRLINFAPSSLENSSEISLKMEKFLDKKITAYFLIEKLYKFRLLKKTLLSFFFLFKGKIRFKDLLFIIF